MFIRTKIIKDKEYLYLVHTYREGKKVKQTQRYIGKTGEVEVNQQKVFRENLFSRAWGIYSSISDEKDLAESREMKQLDKLRLEEALRLAERLEHSVASIIDRAGEVRKQRVTFAKLYELVMLSILIT